MRPADADVALFRRVQAVESPFLDAVLPRLSRAANHSVLWAAVAAALAARGGKGNRRAALRGVVSLSLASALANVPAKLSVRRSRPPLDDVLPVRRLTRQPTTSSFPSGHAASAAAFAVGVALERPLLAVPVGMLAAMVALSRVRTGVHYPSDVAAGVALGTATALALTRGWPTPPSAAERSEFTPVDVPALPDGAGVVVVANLGAGRSGADQHTVLDKCASGYLAEVVLAEPDSAWPRCSPTRPVVLRCSACSGVTALSALPRAAVDADVPLLVIPGGTLNHLAADLGLIGLDDAVSALREGTASGVDAPEAGGDIFINAASVGSYPELVALRERLEARIGKWPALLVALISVLSRAEPPRLELDGRERRLWLLFAGNCRYEPPGFAPSWRPRLDDGLLDIRLVDATHPGALAPGSCWPCSSANWRTARRTSTSPPSGCASARWTHRCGRPATAKSVPRGPRST